MQEWINSWIINGTTNATISDAINERELDLIVTDLLK